MAADRNDLDVRAMQSPMALPRFDAMGMNVERKVAEETRAFQRSEERRDAADVVGQLQAKGMSVTQMPAAEFDKIRTAVR